MKTRHVDNLHTYTPIWYKMQMFESAAKGSVVSYDTVSWAKESQDSVSDIKKSRPGSSRAQMPGNLPLALYLT
jgi:hypothetical protein